MKKLYQALKKLIHEILDIYQARDIKGMILLSVMFLIGFLWPLAGIVLYFIGRAKPAFKDFGWLALLGAGLNLIAYLIQIIVRLAQQVH